MLTIDQFLPKSAGAAPSAENASIVYKHEEGYRLTRHQGGSTDVFFVVWDGNTIIASGSYNSLQMPERLANEDKIQTVYRVLARGAIWLLVLTRDPIARLTALDKYNDFVEAITQLEDYQDDRVTRAMSSWKEEGEIAHFAGNAILARAEALYLAFPTWNYEVISKEVDGVKMEAMVQYGVPGIRLLYTVKNVDEKARAGQELKRWYTLPLDGDWYTAADNHLAVMSQIAQGNKAEMEEPAQPQAKPAGRPKQDFTCEQCGATYEIMPFNRFEAVKVRCKECGHDQVDAYRAK
ncbi:hypothetical protein STRATTON_90 [Erwinia phage vB_EamM_Stratton]|uniref:Uncharacterized protein n=2 Tax=Erskinevirus EaH2 TaxID=2169883 RepID=A0A1B2IGZ8_9CAUD|nr:hypothetical protein G173_gp257 [Erwinia phage phiEaH2]AFQ96802.1 hypothetical protein [Erwinia phage phiEaH2]ANZ50515.1 hypothetical protein STRATTON_90 [Erwinia phage vB_EamM_Stratton]